MGHYLNSIISLRKYIYLNNQILSLKIHAGYKSSDYCRKKNAGYVIFFLCYGATFMLGMNQQRKHLIV